MTGEHIMISAKGRQTPVPSCEICGRTVIATGKWVKTAVVHDEFFLPGEVVADPEQFVDGIKRWSVRPDVLKFSQKVSDPEPKHAGRFKTEFDNFAVIKVTSYDHWFRKQARKDARQNVRRAAREGIEVRVCPYDDGFVKGIKSVYDESPVRQGRPFWHYGKDLEEIRRENGTYRERAEYIGAFLEDELVGFIKMVYVGEIAKTMQVICKEGHFRKRPTNALIAKAVEVCAEKGVKYFNYGPYEYPGKKESSLTTFKYRHGFERIDFPTYYVPLSWKGRVYLALGMHRGWKRLVPAPVLSRALKIRSALRSR